MAEAPAISPKFDSYILPADNNELLGFITKYKKDAVEHVISSFEYAVKNHLPIVEIFQFKNSEFFVTVIKEDFGVNLDKIYEYSIEQEYYELCSRIKKLREQLKINNNNDKPKNNET